MLHNWLILWGRVLVEKLVVAQLAEIFAASYGTQRAVAGVGGGP
jgi:hypothetical protein